MTRGSITAKHFSLGYQAAMEDVIDAYDGAGVNGILQWLEGNTNDAGARARLAAAVEAVNTARFGR